MSRLLQALTAPRPAHLLRRHPVPTSAHALQACTCVAEGLAPLVGSIALTNGKVVITKPVDILGALTVKWVQLPYPGVSAAATSAGALPPPPRPKAAAWHAAGPHAIPILLHMCLPLLCHACFPVLCLSGGDVTVGTGALKVNVG